MSPTPQRSRRAQALTLMTASVALILSACSSDGSAEGTGDGDDATSVTLGFPGSIGPTDVPAILALEAMEADGATTEFIEFDSPDVQTQALTREDVNLVSMGPSTVMSADIAGADIKMVAVNNYNDLQVVVAPDVNSCEDLSGQPVAIHSEGSTSTAHLRRWFADECGDAAEPEWLVISGSENRAVALLEGQIKGTVVRMEDWISVTGGESADAKILAPLGETQQTLLTQTIAASGDTIENDREMITSFLDALNTQLEAVNSDPSAFAEEAARILDKEAADLAPIYQALVDNGTFPDTVGVEAAYVEDTLTFYQESGTIPEGELTVEDVAVTDLS